MTTEQVVLRLELRGANAEAYNCRDREILDEGPAGTGKTLMWLWLMNNLAHKFSGLHGLIARKTAVTLTTSCLVTFNTEVLKPEDGVVFFGGSKAEPAAYRYPNGSTITVGGFDKGPDGGPTKILSTQYHIAYVNEITELTAEDLETLTTRVRPHGEPLVAANGTVFKDYRIVADCNPSTDRHWVNRRCNEGKTRRFKSKLEDNPLYFHEDGTPTEAGSKYLESLDALTGTRYQRLRLGLWVGMENAIYDMLDPAQHLRELPELVAWHTGAIGVDYGKVHLSAVVAIQRDSTGIVWVRDCWAETGGNPQMIKDAVNGMRTRYRISRGRVDPIQEHLGQSLGFSVAKSAAGSRKARIDLVYDLLAKGALMFDKDSDGVRDLFDEALSYRWERRETDTNIEDVPVRKDDDRVAALEYAVEELMTTYTGPTIRTVALQQASQARTPAVAPRRGPWV